ncbi:TIGR02270 family protein [Cystobacter ferrugineus]|uniref:TIGR02270 family protein n=1 Tax=Cystobacter ferrugineus TaxID=83449 RepID=A0A1L9B540_9BACT|nr:TIGR02270 family protein [Cystobacter ferrugineus]OJH37379.1 hypothetical protein BON30_29260 [Cystobacter ferrugineus]
MHLRTDLILNWSQYEDHLDEATFQWSQWEQLLRAPDELLAEVTAGEERLLARLDALVLGGEPVAARLLKPALTSDEPERLSTAVFALLSGRWHWGPDAVLGVLGESGPEEVGAMQRALELLEPSALPAWLQSVLSRGSLSLQALALDVLGAHSVNPELPLAGFIASGVPSVAAAALRAAARLRVRLDWPLLRQPLSTTEPSLRDAALIAALLSGHREAWTTCRELALARDPAPGLPMLLMSMGAGPGAVPLLRGLLEKPELRADVHWALGFNGHVAAAELCLEHLGDETVGHLAAEAFCAITGLSLTERFVAAPPEVEDADSEEPLEYGRHTVPGRGLPVPNPEAIRAWWKEARKQFEPAVRYLRGRVWTPTVFLQSLWSEPMRRRHVLALEATLRSQGVFQLRTDVFARQQLASLETLRTAALPLVSRPLAEGLIS